MEVGGWHLFLFGGELRSHKTIGGKLAQTSNTAEGWMKSRRRWKRRWTRRQTGRWRGGG